MTEHEMLWKSLQESELLSDAWKGIEFDELPDSIKDQVYKIISDIQKSGG